MTAENNQKQSFDKELIDIIDFVYDYEITSEEAIKTAFYCLIDSVGCGILALQYTECTKLLGPLVPGSNIEKGTRVFGTDFELDPVQGAFNIGALIRWLDFNDTWLAAEWGHPSDNLGAILAVTDYLNRTSDANFTVNDVLISMIKAHEIQGVLALDNSFNRVGLDHVVLVKVASTAVAAKLFGASKEQALNALSLAWVDGQSLRTYRHAPNTGSRKSWAAGDATSRGVRLALMAMQGEMGYPSVLSAPTWGFYDVLFKGQSFSFQRPYGNYVMENILFKISFPAEFHAQTAAECGVQLHSQVKNRMDEIERIEMQTQEAAIRIINKGGPLHNPADRDHSLQYITAVALIYGELTADHYEKKIADNPLIDVLRGKMQVIENKAFSNDYLDPEKRSIANAVKIHFKDGTSTDEICIHYPVGHRRRRGEGIPLLLEKFKHNVSTHYAKDRADKIVNACMEQDTFKAMPVSEFMELFL